MLQLKQRGMRDKVCNEGQKEAVHWMFIGTAAPRTSHTEGAQTTCNADQVRCTARHSSVKKGPADLWSRKEPPSTPSKRKLAQSLPMTSFHIKPLSRTRMHSFGLPNTASLVIILAEQTRRPSVDQQCSHASSQVSSKGFTSTHLMHFSSCCSRDLRSRRCPGFAHKRRPPAPHEAIYQRAAFTENLGWLMCGVSNIASYFFGSCFKSCRTVAGLIWIPYYLPGADGPFMQAKERFRGAPELKFPCRILEQHKKGPEALVMWPLQALSSLGVYV